MLSPDLCSATRSTAQASGSAAVPSTRASCATTERDAPGQAPRDLHTRMHQIIHRSISMLLAEGAGHPDVYFCNRFSKTAFWQCMAIDGILGCFRKQDQRSAAKLLCYCEKQVQL
eukprot:1664008-Pleurochrysis_carterae.AAC.1